LQVDWSDKVARDFRCRILVDSNSPILAFKANRDHYYRMGTQSNYAGLAHLGSVNSEDALTWNVFRSLQKADGLNIISNRLEIGEPKGLLLWTLAPELDDISAKLQYKTGEIIRKFDGVLRGQITEPDVILLATSGIAVIECKFSEPKKTPAHLWEGRFDRVARRLPIYKEKNSLLLKYGIDAHRVTPVYQLVRLAFYAMELSNYFGVEPVVVSLANELNWIARSSKTGKSASDWWDIFINILGKNAPRCEKIFWQQLPPLIEGKSLDTLSAYLSAHPRL